MVPPAAEAAVKLIIQHQQSSTVPLAPDVFVRIRRLGSIWDSGKILGNAYLADPTGSEKRPPVAFLTIPEGIAGFTADAVLSRLGYTTGEIADLFGSDRAAAIVFRYPDPVQSLAAWDVEPS